MSVTQIAEAVDLSADHLKIPFYTESVPAGFPSPAQDYIDKTLSLNELCIKHPNATYFVRVDGDSMDGVGIFKGDVLVVDRSLTASHGDVVIASVGGEMTVKTLQLKPRVRLIPQNRRYSPIDIKEGSELQVFGVVVSVVRVLR
jgi:DNA polymerase V